MVLFSFIAGVLVGVAASLVALPLWRGASALAAGRGKRHLAAAGFVASFALAAAVIYLAIGSRHSLEPATSATGSAPDPAILKANVPGSNAKSMQAEVAGLEARLARDGGTPADWTLLAQAYDFLGRPEDARRARERTGDPGAAPSASRMSAPALVAAAAAVDTRQDTQPTTTGSPTAVAAGATSAAAAAPSAAELERHLATHPRDAQSWLALADLRRGQRDFAGARVAYQKVVDLRGMSAQSWADYADVLGSLAGGSLDGAAGRAIDNALALDATNPKALWLKASQANEQHRYVEALDWWQKLRALLPADSADAPMVDANIAEATTLAGLPPAAAPPGNGEVSGTVSLDSRLAARVQAGATLFIYAKAADAPGPPLAVFRTTPSEWPVTFRLDDSMAMVPSRRLSQFDKVVVEARISRSGQATPGPGDLYVTSPILHPAAGTKLTLVINREIG